MVQLIASEKGQGKTKKLIELANANKSDGNIAFIDYSNKHIYDLNHSIRLVETNNFPLSNYREFTGFICGLLSQDSDLNEIYIDGLNNILEKINFEDLIKLIAKLEKLSKSLGVNFTIGLNAAENELPKELIQHVVNF